MQFRAEQYFQASLERMAQAHRIYRDGEGYALAMYCGGLAVESMLRAFRWSHDSSFEGRHDLFELLRASRLLSIDEAYTRQKGASHVYAGGAQLRANMNEITTLWNNSLRFASEASLSAFLKNIGRARGIKGDPRKKSAMDLLNAAQTVIDLGMTLWSSRTKSQTH